MRDAKFYEAIFASMKRESKTIEDAMAWAKRTIEENLRAPSFKFEPDCANLVFGYTFLGKPKPVVPQPKKSGPGTELPQPEKPVEEKVLDNKDGQVFCPVGPTLMTEPEMIEYLRGKGYFIDTKPRNKGGRPKGSKNKDKVMQ